MTYHVFVGDECFASPQSEISAGQWRNDIMGGVEVRKQAEEASDVTEPVSNLISTEELV